MPPALYCFSLESSTGLAEPQWMELGAPSIERLFCLMGGKPQRPTVAHRAFDAVSPQ